MNIIIIEKEISDVYEVKAQIFGDNRGCFMETYSKRDFDALGLSYDWVQDNQSCSRKGVLRGLHFQKKHPQAKLVRVISGLVYDVVVDLRAGSPTYGRWLGETLNAEEKNMLLIPRGFAHGFLVLSDYAEVAYKCDDYYYAEDGGGIIWNDPTIGVEWPLHMIDEIIQSEKDKQLPTLAECRMEFK